MAGRVRGAGQARVHRRRARPGGGRQATRRLAVGPRSLPPGDQHPRRLCRRRRAGRLGQAGGLRRRRRRDGSHLGAQVLGEAMSELASETMSPSELASETMSLTPIPPPLRCSVDELRTLFLFEKLTDDQLNWLCDNGHVEYFEPGSVYAEGDPATCFYVLLNGTLVLSRRVGVDDVETTRTSQRGVYSGAMR